jgi:hypothetical protein
VTSTAAVLLARRGSEVWESPIGTGDGPSLISHALRRELALVHRRATHASRSPHVHRLPGRGGRLRSALAAGAVVETGAGTGPRVLDEVAAAAGLRRPPGRLRPVAGGGVVADAVDGGGPVLLRVAGPRSPDPRDALDALAPLSGRGLPIPEPRRSGTVADHRWTTEARLDGRRPRRLRDPLLDDVIAFLAALARGSGTGPTSVLDDLESLGQVLPARADVTAAVRRSLVDEVPGTPATFRHGDLWLGNLLAHRGRLRGVVDWDAARPGGVPGADLLQLLVTDDRHRRTMPLGAAWLERPWLTDRWLRATSGYWTATGIVPDASLLHLAAIAWWAAEVVGTATRHPERAEDDAWLGRNVDPVLAALG